MSIRPDLPNCDWRWAIGSRTGILSEPSPNDLDGVAGWRAAPYVIRVKVPSSVKLMPHQHPEDRVYTVISGVFYIGLGSVFDEERLQAYPPGAVIVLPGGTPHFHWAKSGTYVTQVSAVGPLGLEYIDPIDDPRNQCARSGLSMATSTHVARVASDGAGP